VNCTAAYIGEVILNSCICFYFSLKVPVYLRTCDQGHNEKNEKFIDCWPHLQRTIK